MLITVDNVDYVIYSMHKHARQVFQIFRESLDLINHLTASLF